MERERETMFKRERVLERESGREGDKESKKLLVDKYRVQNLCNTHKSQTFYNLQFTNRN